MDVLLHVPLAPGKYHLSPFTDNANKSYRSKNTNQKLIRSKSYHFKRIFYVK